MAKIADSVSVQGKGWRVVCRGVRWPVPTLRGQESRQMGETGAAQRREDSDSEDSGIAAAEAVGKVAAS